MSSLSAYLSILFYKWASIFLLFSTGNLIWRSKLSYSLIDITQSSRTCSPLEGDGIRDNWYYPWSNGSYHYDKTYSVLEACNCQLQLNHRIHYNVYRFFPVIQWSGDSWFSGTLCRWVLHMIDLYLTLADQPWFIYPFEILN